MSNKMYLRMAPLRVLLLLLCLLLSLVWVSLLLMIKTSYIVKLQLVKVEQNFN